jgi:hypothetical protein
MSINSAQPTVFSEVVGNTSTTLARGIELGTEQWLEGAKYRLCYQAGTTTATPGAVVFQTDTTPNYVTVAAPNALSPIPAGIAISTASTGTYHWVLAKGYYASVINSGTAFAVGSLGVPTGTFGIQLASSTMQATGVASSIVQYPFFLAMSAAASATTTVAGFVSAFQN